MPNLLSSLSLGALPDTTSALAGVDSPVNGNLQIQSDGSHGLPVFSATLSQSLEQLQTQLSAWVAEGDGTLQELPLDLPLAGNMLPPELEQRLIAGDAEAIEASLQQWLATLPIATGAADTLLADGEPAASTLSVNIEGGRPRPAIAWIRNAVLGSLNPDDASAGSQPPTADTAREQVTGVLTDRARQLSAGEVTPQSSPLEGRGPLHSRGMTWEQAVSQLLPAAAGGKAGDSRTAPLTDALAGVTPTATPPATPPTPLVNTAGGGQTFSINLSPGQSGWSEAVGEKVGWLLQNNQNSAQVRLNPPHLGPMEIKVAMAHDQANVTFTVHHQVTADQLEAALPRLREMMAENGLQLANLDVRHQGQNGQGGSSGEGAGGAAATADLDPLAGDDAPGGAVVRELNNGLLDTYA